MPNQKKFTFIMPWHISERGGGAEVQANFLAQELARRNYDVAYVCQTQNKIKVGTIEKIEHINVHWLKPSGRFQWLDQNKYIKPLLDIQPDVVVQRLSSNTTYIIGKFAKKYNKKFIWICTDNKNPFTNFHRAKFKDQFTAKRLGFLKYVLFYTNSCVMDYFRNKGMTFVNVALTQNKNQEKNLKAQFGKDSYRIISGHPIPQTSVSIERRLKSKLILWCANLGSHKRPELFIELARSMEDSGLRFVMIGGHSNALYVQKLLKNKPSNLTTTGRLSFEEALDYFDKAALFVNTSSPGGDGFPNTFIQSWLRGVPVLSFGFDPDDVVVKNKLGYVVDDIDKAQGRLRKQIFDEVTYKMMSKNVINYAVNHHTISIMTDGFLEVLNENSL